MREQDLASDQCFWGSASPFLQLSGPAGHGLGSGAMVVQALERGQLSWLPAGSGSDAGRWGQVAPQRGSRE